MGKIDLDFSIIIPVAPDRGAEVLKSIKELNYPKYKYEVIVERGLNPSRNRNNGVLKAKGKILCFLDDDAVVDKNLLKNAQLLFEAYPISIAGGPQLTPEDDPYFAKACGEVFSSYFGAFKMSNRYKKGKANYNADENSLTSANMFVKAADYDKIGGFNESLFPGEDPEFLARAKTKGHKIAYSPDLIVYHRRRSNLLAFIKQFFSYGKSRMKKEEIGGTKPGLIFYIPLLFTIYCMGIVFLPSLGIISGLSLIPLYVYACIALLVSSFIGLKNNASYIIVLPFLFFLTHFFYGLGMMEGWMERVWPEQDTKEVFNNKLTKETKKEKKEDKDTDEYTEVL